MWSFPAKSYIQSSLEAGMAGCALWGQKISPGQELHWKLPLDMLLTDMLS